jgi:hypothetical protein
MERIGAEYCDYPFQPPIKLRHWAPGEFRPPKEFSLTLMEQSPGITLRVLGDFTGDGVGSSSDLADCRALKNL